MIVFVETFPMAKTKSEFYDNFGIIVSDSCVAPLIMFMTEYTSYSVPISSRGFCPCWAAAPTHLPAVGGTHVKIIFFFNDPWCI
jgi:hypothetical protein